MPVLKKIFIWISFLAVSGINAANASNGINLTGFGAESVGMGGADLALRGIQRL